MVPNRVPKGIPGTLQNRLNIDLGRSMGHPWGTMASKVLSEPGFNGFGVPTGRRKWTRMDQKTEKGNKKKTCVPSVNQKGR